MMDDHEENLPESAPKVDAETPPKRSLTREDRMHIRRACMEVERVVTKWRTKILKDLERFPNLDRDIKPSTRMSPTNKGTRRAKHLIATGKATPDFLLAHVEAEEARRELRRAHAKAEQALRDMRAMKDELIGSGDPWLKRAEAAKQNGDDFSRLVCLMRALFPFRSMIEEQDYPVRDNALDLITSLGDAWEAEARARAEQRAQPPPPEPEPGPPFPVPPFSDLEFDPADGVIVARLAEGSFDPVEDYKLNFAAQQLVCVSGYREHNHALWGNHFAVEEGVLRR